MSHEINKNKMKEELMHFIWNQKYLMKFNLKTTQGLTLKIIKPGIHNSDSGPDFFNSRIVIGEMEWVGNVELHINSSDWFKHNHQKDDSYKNVILHVVWHHDQEVLTDDQKSLPTLELKTLINEQVLSSFQYLLESNQKIPCANIFDLPPQIETIFWLERLSIERLETKFSKIKMQHSQLKEDWNALFYLQLAMAFGQKTNSFPFELLTRSLPYSIIKKHVGNSFSMQALVLGSAGFLSQKHKDSYNLSLFGEYKYLKQKHGISSMPAASWKFGKIRPANFATLRLFQFSEFISQNPQLLNLILGSTTINEVKNGIAFSTQQKIDIGDLHPGEKNSHFETNQLSKEMVNSLIINAIIPIKFSYEKICNHENDQTTALSWLKEIEAENNSITKFWTKLGIPLSNASSTQATLQLNSYYCKEKRCLKCAFGNHLLKRKLFT